MTRTGTTSKRDFSNTIVSFTWLLLNFEYVYRYIIGATDTKLLVYDFMVHCFMEKKRFQSRTTNKNLQHFHFQMYWCRNIAMNLKKPNICCCSTKRERFVHSKHVLTHLVREYKYKIMQIFRQFRCVQEIFFRLALNRMNNWKLTTV